ncbi:MAG: TetR/AcrR family transcriptional regulator [Clostridia bacterium]|nr:TetR/AcrR family transcriptional regulator [Clostridia bacterium]
MDAEKGRLIHDEMTKSIIDTAERLAMTEGAHTVTVRKIIQALGVSGRVFYNRFHNVEEVLDVVYRNTVLKIRESISARFDPEGDFFSQVVDIVADTLILSYEAKRRFNQYVFEYDSVSQDNYEWWIAEIKKLIEFAKTRGLIRNLDADVMSYSIWCYCRGYNADAVGRGIPREEAVKNFRYGFSVFLDGMKNRV